MGKPGSKMKLLPVLYGLSRGSDGVSSIEMSRSEFPNSHECGYMNGFGGMVSDDFELGDGESCIFRVQPDHPGQVQLTLLEEEGFLPSCDVAEVHVVIGGNVIGPFCFDPEDKHRRRRHAGVQTVKEEVSETDGEIDMVYSKVGSGGMPNGDGFKFKFQFSFEWELLPGGGKKGEYQEGYSDNVKPYVPTEKPYKPKPTYKPTEKPYEKPTYKPTEKPYKPTYKPTSKPTYTTTKYKTKPTYTTETYTTEEYKE